MYKLPLTILVDSDPDKLRRFDEATEIISIGRELSGFLITEASVDRTQSTIQWLEATLREKAPGPVSCTDIDLLFEPALKLDPLAVFRRISRHTQLIVHWTGEFKNNVLSYAIPEHKHYRFWKYLTGVEIKGVSDAL